MAFILTSKYDRTHGAIISTATYRSSSNTVDGTVNKIVISIKDSMSNDYITYIAYSSRDELVNGYTKTCKLFPFNVQPPITIKWSFEMQSTAGVSISNDAETVLEDYAQPEILIIGENSSYACYMDALITPTRNAMVTTYNTIQSAYPFVIYNSTNRYDTGKAEGFWAEWDDNLQDFDYDAKSNALFRNEIKEFLYDFKPKLIRYRDGSRWLVGISEQTITEIRDKSDQHIGLSFGWTEIGLNDTDNLMGYNIAEGVVVS